MTESWFLIWKKIRGINKWRLIALFAISLFALGLAVELILNYALKLGSNFREPLFPFAIFSVLSSKFCWYMLEAKYREYIHSYKLDEALENEYGKKEK